MVKIPENKPVRGFPYEYFKGEVLTDEIVESRIREIYIYFKIYIPITFFVSPIPILEQALFPSATISIERISNELDLERISNELDLKRISNYKLSIEKISNLKLNSDQGHYDSGKIIEIGNDRILELGGEASDPSSNPLDSQTNENQLSLNFRGGGDDFRSKIIALAVTCFRVWRTYNMLNNPSADAFNQKLSPLVTRALSVRKADNFDVRPGNFGNFANGGNRGNQCPRFSRAQNLNMEEKFEEFIRDVTEKGLDVDCSLQRFKELSFDFQIKGVNNESVYQASGALQAEALGHYENLSLPSNRAVNLDYQATKKGKRIFVDIKSPVDNKLLAKKGVNVSRRSHMKVAYDIGIN